MKIIKRDIYWLSIDSIVSKIPLEKNINIANKKKYFLFSLVFFKLIQIFLSRNLLERNIKRDIYWSSIDSIVSKIPLEKNINKKLA